MITSPEYQKAAPHIKQCCLRFQNWAAQNQLYSLGLAIADEHYYDKTLQQRQTILKAPSTKYLCKTIILENTAYDPKYEGPHYPKYICVVFQYVTKFHSEKLAKFMKAYQNNNSPTHVKASNKCFHWRLVDGKLSDELSGYEHNGVVPILMRTEMPIVVSHHIEHLSPQFFWMGGGHPIIKLSNILFSVKVNQNFVLELGISFKEFKKANKTVLVGDVTD